MKYQTGTEQERDRDALYDLLHGDPDGHHQYHAQCKIAGEG